MTWDEWRDWFERRRRLFPFFDWYFKDIDTIMRNVERMMEETFRGFFMRMPENLIREKKLPDGSIIKESGPIIWGYSMTIGPDGKPVVREFGNLKPSVQRRPWEPPFSLKEEREPLVDLVETDSEVKIIAELPGIEKEDINLYATSNSLIIDVDTKERKYHKEMNLPSEVDPKGARSTYKNGVLEVTLKKIEKKKPTGVPISIE
ncbi:MAG: archaeal heat shock protein Hsp20 [Candidatus Bathyarchaeia archaeon]